jgi:hypothetical protein
MSTCTYLCFDLYNYFLTSLFFHLHFYNNSSEKSSYEKYCHIGSSLVCFLGQQLEEKMEPVERGSGVARKNSDVV